MIVQLIHNPASRSHKPDRLSILTRAFEACGAKVQESVTVVTGSLDIVPDCDLLCVSGGDGALRLVVSALTDSGRDIPVCVYPAGTVNLIAREIGYSKNPELFVQQVMRGYLAGDRGRLKAPTVSSDQNTFIACVSAGPDSLSVAAVSLKLKRYVGGLAYGVSFMKQLVKWPKQNFDLTVARDGQKVQLRCEAFYIAKSHYFAGPWTLVKESHLGHDQFFLIAIRSVSRWNYVRFMTYMALHRDLSNLKFVKIIATDSISINPLDNMSQSKIFQMDGDLMESPPSRIQMTGQAINYCLPIAD